MPCTLPPEILDLIIDLLHDQPVSLKSCCVVSKSWVPRTRKHLFAHVEFHHSETPIELWKKAFPDPSNSPAHHTHSLLVNEPPFGFDVDSDAGDWFRPFHNVVHLEFRRMDRASLVPFHGLFPAVRSIRLTFSTAEVFDLVCSFPLLEDLSIQAGAIQSGGDAGGWNAPLTSPKLTGTLSFRSHGWSHNIIRRLLDLPGGLHFSKIDVKFFDREAESVKDLVLACSNTLESLTTYHYLSYAARMVLPDLSKATKLKHLKFMHTTTRSAVQGIIMMLRTVESKTLQSITICLNSSVLETVGETAHREWDDLDWLLVQFWTSHSIRPRVMYVAGTGGKDLRNDAPSLLPELSKRGLVDFVDTPF